jgi:hypothetical protein
VPSKIFVFVHRSSAQRGPDVTGDEFLAQIFDVSGTCARRQRLFSRRFQIFLLAEVANHGDHFAARIGLLEPGNNDGGIQTS